MTLPRRRWWLAGALFAALAALIAPHVQRAAHVPPQVSDAFPGWPETWEGHPLVPLPLSELEQRFARDFPGRVGRFRSAGRELVLAGGAREEAAFVGMQLRSDEEGALNREGFELHGLAFPWLRRPTAPERL